MKSYLSKCLLCVLFINLLFGQILHADSGSIWTAITNQNRKIVPQTLHQIPSVKSREDLQNSKVESTAAEAQLNPLIPSIPKPKIAFTGELNDGSDKINLYLMNVDGSDLKLFAENVMMGSNIWSPDGTKIAFIKNYEQFNIFVKSVDEPNGEITKLTPEGNAAAIAWSPDSQEILFTKNVGQSWDEKKTQIFLKKANEGNVPPKNLTSVSNDLYDYANTSTWSPDGTQIAFVGSAANGMGIYMMNSDGSEVKKLTDLHRTSINLTWIPGKRLLYTDETGVYMFYADGSERLVKLVPVKLGRDWDDVTSTGPALSSDKKRMAYVCPDRPAEPNKKKICVLNTDGSGESQVPAEYETTSNWTAESPAWTPDSKKILYIESEDSPSIKKSLYEVNVDGSEKIKLKDFEKFKSVSGLASQPLSK